jgi:hypothetical protein
LIKGTFGLKGHCCAFTQEIGEFAEKLPRMKSDATLLKVMQAIRAEIGSERATQKYFKVNRVHILEALRFLKKHSLEYKDIVIAEEHLEWLDENGEGVLEGSEVFTESEDSKPNTEQDCLRNVDRGPCPQVAVDPQEESEYIPDFGYIEEGGTGVISEQDADITEQLKDTISKSKGKQSVAVDWPAIDANPVYEYGNTRIFPAAFPWLFPGGIGDIKDFNGSMADWGKMMLFYEDGRFAKDKVFCFFAMNYIIRHRNSTGGKYFIDTFQKDCPDNLEELKEQISNGKTNFVNSLSYYNRRIKGSSAYWKQKRSEVHSWINHHVQKGHGVPNFFITLSCAEYYWHDIVRLLQDRIRSEGGDPSDCYVGSPKIVQYANEYSIVVQEYFQERVRIWLEIVGKEVFGIKYYWCRYEFAPGRGQIHVHLLAMSEDQWMLRKLYSLSKEEDGEKKRAVFLSEWAEKKLGMTASVDNGYDDIQINKDNTPVSLRFTDISGSEEDIRKDGQELLRAVQHHECSGFCMRPNGKW